MTTDTGKVIVNKECITQETDIRRNILQCSEVVANDTAMGPGHEDHVVSTIGKLLIRLRPIAMDGDPRDSRPIDRKAGLEIGDPSIS